MNMGNMGNVMTIISLWKQFKSNHPKASNFLHAVVKKGVEVDSIIEVKITYPNGEVLESSIRVKDSDAAMIDQIRKMKEQ